MNYHIYKLSLYEYFLYGLLYILADAIISYLFFMSIIPFIFFLLGIFVFFKIIKSVLKKHRDKILTFQFKEFISVISTLLSTGYSLENAIFESLKELSILYPKSYILDEVQKMTNKLTLHIPPDILFKDLASRCDIDHIKTFSEILTIASKSGGNLIQIILSTTSSITTQIDIYRDIDISIAGKKYEFLIMDIMPIIIMIYIKLTQPSFFNPIYSSLIGRFLMLICLCFYALAVYIGYKIISNINK